MEPLPDSEMDRLTRSLRTKAEKIRALGRAGVGAGAIGRYLGIRYQHAYNVLRRSGLLSRMDGVRDTDRPGARSPSKAVLDEAGRISLPREILETWGASPGDELLIRLEGDELHVLTRSAGLRLARNILRKYPASGRKSMSEELIAERRQEARNDG